MVTRRKKGVKRKKEEDARTREKIKMGMSEERRDRRETSKGKDATKGRKEETAKGRKRKTEEKRARDTNERKSEERREKGSRKGGAKEEKKREGKRRLNGRRKGQLADAGFHCFAPDWLGFGFSDKPQAGFDGFDYTEKEYHEQFDKLLDVLKIESPFALVVQGFLVGSYGLTWALKNPDRISKLVIMNTPLTASSPIPGLFQQLRIPLLGEFTCQNAITAERFIEAGSAYVLKVEKADVYRLPYLKSSGPGFALLEATKRANFRGTSGQIAEGFSSGRWDKPILVAWGISDKYLPQSIAEEFQKGNPSAVTLKLIEGAGHMPQEDWPEKVFDALRYFL
ncbi:alpha/beta hydrolase fold-1 [Tanacetum coccineum]